jgi:hypothetical protein
MKAAQIPSLNDDRKLSRTLTFLRRMTVWKKQNCEVFSQRLPVLILNSLCHSQIVSEASGHVGFRCKFFKGEAY